MAQATAVQQTELKKVDPSHSEASPAATSSPPADESKKSPCKKHAHHENTSTSKGRKSKKASRKAKAPESDSPSSSNSSIASTGSDDDSSADEDSPAIHKKRNKKIKKAKADLKKLQVKEANRKKKLMKMFSEESDDSASDESDEEAENKHLTKAHRKALKQLHIDEDDEDDSDIEDASAAAMRHQLLQRTLQQQLAGLDLRGLQRGKHNQLLDPRRRVKMQRELALSGIDEKALRKAKKPHKLKRASKIAFKRVDELWDGDIHNFKLSATVPDSGASEWDQYIFNVRRKFDWEQKYQQTFVDIKSQPLKECLQHVMAGVKGVSLVVETPHIDPNMLFLYLEEARAYSKQLEEESRATKKKKDKKMAATKAQHLKILCRYLDKDYAETKKTLYPMLENNTITFDLLWALFKPNSIAYTTTYGDSDQPRAFKVDYATKECHFMKGTWYNIEGKYLENDGKSFGMGTMSVQVQSFQGSRRIIGLDCYPLKYHRNAESLRTQLIERGKKFVSLDGVHYKYHKGMAYTKRKRQILKINIDGRVMCDPAIHRRVNPNYQISTVKPKEMDDEMVFDSDGEPEESSDCGCGGSSDSGNDRNTPTSSEEAGGREHRKFKVVKVDGRAQVVEFDPNDEVNLAQKDRIEESEDKQRAFTEEELLISSPVVLGFAFSEKLWLELTVSGISDVVFNDQAFDSLVLPDTQKSIVKALVSSHAFHPSKSIDDIISGKGRGLCCVLHGPPGTGKTLTAEGIADLLKCPLYMVSAGDLGTDPRNLEKELQNILDIAHSWGAILLLDEADVFLEKRSIHDIHRNALVSIFLRLLEYFQGILFLTTNRVQTFDEAFVSRIHLSLRYEELSIKARLRVWKLFIEKVKSTEGLAVSNITERDYESLAKRDVNGRQIKNLVRAAQALAVNESVPLNMSHVKRVIDVAESFVRDLKGGTGYSEAMRSMYLPAAAQEFPANTATGYT